MRPVGHADRVAMYRSLTELIAAHGITTGLSAGSSATDSGAPDLTPAEADAFARDIEAIRNLPTIDR